MSNAAEVTNMIVARTGDGRNLFCEREGGVEIEAKIACKGRWTDRSGGLQGE